MLHTTPCSPQWRLTWSSVQPRTGVLKRPQTSTCSQHIEALTMVLSRINNHIYICTRSSTDENRPASKQMSLVRSCQSHHPAPILNAQRHGKALSGLASHAWKRWSHTVMRPNHGTQVPRAVVWARRVPIAAVTLSICCSKSPTRLTGCLECRKLSTHTNK